MPPLEIQEKISQIITSIVNKITVNKEINKNLLQLSKVIFKNWFVEFEPFDGVQPDDWKTCALEEVCDLNAGGDKPEVVSDEITESCIYPIYSNGLDNEGLYGYTNHAKIFEECVTVSARGTIGFVCLRHTPYVPIVRLVSVIPKKEFISAKYLYLFLDRLNIMGTGTTQQQLTIPDFKKTEILVPTLDVIEGFTNHLNPLFEKIWIQEEEIKKLSKLRDTLLPKLMSGEIDVSKINCD
ncbi:MAG: restriction endonuclease subunit S [Methanobrevibacter sp.]|nr:restriction endonuclease subunit S [Methanobrevibacter sp.]